MSLKKNTSDTFIKYALQFHNDIQDVLKYMRPEVKDRHKERKAFESLQENMMRSMKNKAIL